MDEEQRKAKLIERSESCCELCKETSTLEVLFVPPGQRDLAHCMLTCETCRAQIEGSEELNDKHWFCLKEAIWSGEAAVQVVSWRVLKRLKSDWAQELLGQAYLPDDVQEWASAETDKEEAIATFDSNGATLADGDSVTIIKDLAVKGAGFVAKRGTMVRNIRLVDAENIEGRVNSTTLVLKTKFLKKVS